jgi:hypothetical protein
MDSGPHDAQLHQQLRSEVTALGKQREKLDKRLSLLRLVLDAFDPVENGNDESGNAHAATKPPSVTDAIKDALKNAGGELLTPPQIRTRLVAAGFSVETHRYLLPTIHGVLHRLAARGEVNETKAGGKKVYGAIPAANSNPSIQ